MVRVVQNISEEDIFNLINLSNQNFGDGYLTFEYFKEVKDSEKYYSWKLVSANEVIGFLVVYKTSPYEVEEKIKDIEVVKNIMSPLYCIDTIVVKTTFKRKGFGKQLINRAINSFEKSSHYVMYAWQHGEKINIQRIAKCFQFNKLLFYKGYWEEECMKGDFRCPAKKDSCVCSMVLYYR